ncbi:MAG: hypothetical protein K8W52_20065 [Deltaproteobacteria bacterium]|nr:hypothetical protein [Deltaproteobacteria bacterium]
MSRQPNDGIDYEMVPAVLRPPRGHREHIAGVELDPFTLHLDRAALPPVRQSFPRPALILAGSLYLAGMSMGLLWRQALLRIRARWDDTTLVLEAWPRGAMARAARADLVDVWLGDDHAMIRTVDGRGLRLVVGRRARQCDRARACDLARELHLPVVDDTGRLMTLPGAVVVRAPHGEPR